MKKTLSYLWPLTKKINSKYSGTLEVTWLNGRKVLDSKNANYSYGALERVLDIGLSHAHADRSSNVLILGLGGGSVIHLLRKKYNYYGKLTAVEIDPAIIDVALHEFRIRDHGPLDLVCQDAFEYIKQSSSPFGLVIIDIFIDLQVPPECFSTEFWKHVCGALDNEGVVIFNAGINSANQEETDRLLKEMSPVMDFKKLDQVYGSNTLLLGTKKQRRS